MLYGAQLRDLSLNVRNGFDGLGGSLRSLTTCVSSPFQPNTVSGCETKTLWDCSGIFFFTGPVLLIFAMVFEWVMGNFFPMMVMGLFSVFWLSFGVLQLPTLDLGAPYATPSDPTGTTAPAYNAAIALYLVVWVSVGRQYHRCAPVV